MFLEMFLYLFVLLKGLVRHGTRHSLKVLPKFYRSQFDSCRPVEVTALDFSPSGDPMFLVGAASIAFYCMCNYVIFVHSYLLLVMKVFFYSQFLQVLAEI